MKKSLIHRLTLTCILTASLAALSGCGGGGNNPATSRNYTIGGSVTGLDSGESVALLENNGNALTVSANGTFVFANAVVGGSPYDVTVGTQPSGQTCTVSGDLGTVGTADVTSVMVSCTNNTYAIGGTVTGLASGESLGLLDNNGDALTVSANGAFVFTKALTYGSPYAVTVGAQPVGQTCTVSGGSGTVGTADVTSVAVSCTNNAYTIGGTITGLGNSGLVLANGSDTLKVAANATSFMMPTAVTNGTVYDVTVQANPAALSCTVASGAGTVSAADVTNISVSCVPGAESLLYSFQGGTTDGSNPNGSLIQASDGNFYGMTYNGGPSGYGIVFKITPGGTETVLHSFKGGTKDGGHPYGSLIQASDGNLYGMTYNGGTSGYGVVFEITLGGAETVLHYFTGGTDGDNPTGSLIQASDGNFYGMTQYSGGGAGVIFKITPGGTETVLHSFQGGTTDGGNPNGSLIQGSDGNFYGMTPNGGASGDGVVFKITPGGTETVLHSFKVGTTDGTVPLGSLIQASDGNFYGMTRYGGAIGDGVVFKITPGGTEAVLYSFQGGTTDGGSPFGSLIQASDGNFYGMTLKGGASGDGVVFKITPGGAEAVLYPFQGGTTDGASPFGNLIQASDGNFYGMTGSGGAGSNGTVFEFN